MTKRRVLILGGADFIGGRLAQSLANSGDLQPVLVDRVFGTFASNIERIQCDIGNQRDIEILLSKDISSVVNCVVGDPPFMRRSARALFGALKQAGSMPLLHLSTYAAYGSATGNVTESTSLLGDVDAYAAARAEIDGLAIEYGGISLRPGIVYGPGSARWTGQIGRLLCAKRLGDLGIAGDGYCNLLFVDDLVATMVALVLTPSRAHGAINLCCDERLTWNDYFIHYAKALGVVPIKRISDRRLKLEANLLAPPLKVLSSIVGKIFRNKLLVPELIPPSLLRVCSQDVCLINAKANTLLGRHWTPVSHGVQRAAEWYRTEYYK